MQRQRPLQISASILLPTNQPKPDKLFSQLYPPLGFEALAQSGQGRVHGYVWLFQTPRRAREAFPVGQL